MSNENVCPINEIPLEELEAFKKPRSVAVVTTTFYENWYPRDPDPERISDDKIRGDLALRTAKATLERGHQLILIDGGSSGEFVEALKLLGVQVSPEINWGMSPSRQQGFGEASQLKEVEAIVWTEPEKLSFLEDNCLAIAAQPVLMSEADIVVPRRQADLFRQTYPGYQATSETGANKRWGSILKNEGLLEELRGLTGEFPFLDVWFGPRVFANRPEILELFLRQHKFNPRKHILTDEYARPDKWPDATFLPSVEALYRGLRVASVEVPYRHPEEQKLQEDSADPAVIARFVEKRHIQVNGIVLPTVHLIRSHREDEKSRLVRTK